MVRLPVRARLPAMSEPVDTTRAMLSADLRAEFRDPNSFDAFCVNYFPDIASRFSSGMERTARESLLLQAVDPGQIRASLDAHHRQLSASRRTGQRRNLRVALLALFIAIVSSLITFSVMRKIENTRQRKHAEDVAECLFTNVRQCSALLERANADCMSHDTGSCLLLAVMNSIGTGIPKDQAQAFRNFDELCNNNYLPACYLEGQLLTGGSDIPHSEKRALSLLKKSCDGEYYQACVSLARIYYDGLIVEKDDGLAKHYYQIACTANILPGCTGLGAMYAGGSGQAINRDEALRLYMQACHGGEPHACRNIGKMYQEGNIGSATPDHDRAVKYFRRSCGMKGSTGCTSLGFAYAKALGVVHDSTQAFLNFQQGCLLGDPRGCVNLAEMYETGDGVSPNLERAFFHYQEACEKKNASGCLGLGRMYQTGKFVTPDMDTARHVFTLACQLKSNEGCSRAQQFK